MCVRKRAARAAPSTPAPRLLSRVRPSTLPRPVLRRTSQPFLQVIAALLILIVALGMQAFFQPYEPIALDVLDSLGLFCLLCTQILSILYLYVDTSETLVVDKKAIEYGVTVCLFVLNAAMLLSYACAYVVAYLQLDYRALRCRKRVTLELVVDPAVIERALAVRMLAEGGEEDEERNADGDGRLMWWRHPTKDTVVQWPPLHIDKAASGEATDHWLWLDEKGAFECASTDVPQLFKVIGDDDDAPLPGTTTCLLDVGRKEVSPLLETPHDMGGRSLRCKMQVPRTRFDWVENPAQPQRANGNDALFGGDDEGEGAVEEGIRMGELAVNAADDHTADDEGQARPRSALIGGRVQERAPFATEQARAGETGGEAPVDATPARGNPLATTTWVQGYSRTYARAYWKHTQTGAHVWEAPAGVVEVEMREGPGCDGKRWTHDQFTAHYGGGTEWDAAVGEAAETRRADDGVMYIRAEFVRRYGGTDEWDTARTI